MTWRVYREMPSLLSRSVSKDTYSDTVCCKLSAAGAQCIWVMTCPLQALLLFFLAVSALSYFTSPDGKAVKALLNLIQLLQFYRHRSVSLT